MTGGYDRRGNLTQDATRVLTYDAENRFLTSAPLATPATPNTSQVYDPEGRLASYTNVDGSGTHITELRLRRHRIIAEYDHTSGALLRTYVHGPGADEPVVWFEGSGFTAKHFLVPNYQSPASSPRPTPRAISRPPTNNGPYGEPEINKANPATVNPWAGPRFRYTGQTNAVRRPALLLQSSRLRPGLWTLPPGPTPLAPRMT